VATKSITLTRFFSSLLGEALTSPAGSCCWIERGYEGYVAKDEASAYEGGATRRWLKVNQKDWTAKEGGWRQRTWLDR
jgi:hypothetical protein